MPFRPKEVKDILTTQGDILIRNSTKPARLGYGTSGQFLKTQGAGADPVWANGGGLSNLAKGILPTATGWSTAPSSLANITDEDYSTVTGEGIRDGSACPTAETNNIGEVTVDLGASKIPIYVVAKIGIRRTVGSVVYAALRAGDANTAADIQVGATVSINSSTENVYYIYGIVSSRAAITANDFARYISVRIWGTLATNTINLKVYEIKAYGLAV